MSSISGDQFRRRLRLMKYDLNSIQEIGLDSSTNQKDFVDRFNTIYVSISDLFCDMFEEDISKHGR